MIPAFPKLEMLEYGLFPGKNRLGWLGRGDSYRLGGTGRFGQVVRENSNGEKLSVVLMVLDPLDRTAWSVLACLLVGGVCSPRRG